MSDNNISYELQQIQSTLAALTERLAASTATQVGGMQMYIAVGWSPIIALTDDGTYYYAQIIDWTGGSGIKPPVLQYLCETGWTYNVAEAARVGIVGGGIPDGDKGDITVASGVWTIDNGVVTTAKMGGDVTTAGKAMLTAANAAAQLSLIGAAAASHTHNVSDLLQSGATTNQIIQWNGTAWVPITFTAGIGGTLGSTDNALTRTDGTGGSTLQGSGVTLDDNNILLAPNWTVGSSVYSGQTYSKFCSVGSNIALILGPTGTGFISMQVPDGTTVGGNLRGNNAVDFTYSRALATDVASGVGAVSYQHARVSGIDAFGMGRGLASGNQSFAGGQDYATASGTNSWIYAYGGAASGSYSYAFGLLPSATGSFSRATGERPSAPLYGQQAEASGVFSATGDAQRGRITARRATTDATPSNLFLDGSSARWLVPANSSGTALVKVVARTATAGGEEMTWWRRVNWWRGVGVGTVDIDVETIGTDRGRTGGVWGGGPPWTLAITADTTNGGINVIFTGAPATLIRILSDAQWGEVSYP